MRIDFYHLTAKDISDALPELASKVIESNENMVILTSSKEQTNFFDSLLWTFNPDAWLPHGCYKTGDAQRQPIWITDEYENPNASSIIMILDGMSLPNFSDFKRGLYLFNGKDENSLNKARTAWSDAKKNDCDLHYWQQEANGRWREKER
ncbi:MAG: DNA polymerase III subunit chi [Alphaproteobacteria bacterium]